MTLRFFAAGPHGGHDLRGVAEDLNRQVEAYLAGHPDLEVDLATQPVLCPASGGGLVSALVAVSFTRREDEEESWKE